MTMPAPEQMPPSPAKVEVIAIDNLDPTQKSIRLAVKEANPFDQALVVVAMFIRERRGIVEIYSANQSRVCSRDTIPLQHVRLIRETMTPDVFGDELAHAELGYPDDYPEDDEEEEDDDPAGEPTETNGQPTAA